MPHTPHSWAGIGLATVAAGPTFLLGLVLSAFLGRPADTVSLGVPSLSWGFVAYLAVLAMMVLIAACVIGIIIAFPVVMIAATLLIWLGQTNRGVRLPVFWALAGALLAALPVALVKVDQGSLVAAFALTGAVTASICRCFVRWQPEDVRDEKGSGPSAG